MFLHGLYWYWLCVLFWQPVRRCNGDVWCKPVTSRKCPFNNSGIWTRIRWNTRL